jgi:hypothetical protein
MIKKILKNTSLALTALLNSSGLALAEITNPVTGKWGEGGADTGATEGGLFTKYMVLIWNAIMTIGAILVIILFIKAAFEWIGSGSDKSKVENARNTITQAFIGLVILVGSFVIIAFLSKLLFGEEFEILNLVVPMATDY